MKFFRGLYFFLPLFLYLLALNPYITPDTYDNVVYYEGARSFLSSGEYKVNNAYIVSWPPGVSLLLMIPFSLGFESVIAAKFVMIVLGFFSLFFFLLLMEKEKRAYPLLSCFLFALNPYTLQAFSRILSEAPFLFWSTLCLLTLSHLRDRKTSLLYAIVLSLLLIIAILTRFIGVLLLVPLVIDGTKKARAMLGSERRKEILLCALPFVIGCITFLSWKLYVWKLDAAGSEMDVFYTTLNKFYFFNVQDTLNLIVDSMFGTHLVQGHIDLLWLSIPILLVILTGIYRYERLNSIDVYVLAMVVVISFYEWKIGRYFIYLLPFFYSYFFCGAKVWCSFSESVRKHVVGVVGVLTSLLFIAMNIGLFLYGNGKTYRGISFLTTRTAENYYIGYWNDIYRASTSIKEADIPGEIAALGKVWEINKYIYFFSHHKVTPRLQENTRFLMLENEMEGDPDFSLLTEQFQKKGTYGSISVFEKRDH